MKTCLFLIGLYVALVTNGQSAGFYREKYRPQFHFTPAIHWTNDPNGLVFHKGEYHLFYQFNPFGNRWGHMSWGHAVSTDLVRWQHLPLAIPEEKDTMIFSGTCVVDKNNTAGFATKEGQVPMVAVYTGHIEKVNQSQHLAYSLDDGRTWKKFNRNPVLDLGKKDFRDPKVFWYEAHKKWVMVVALPIEKQIQFYSSLNLKDWKLMSNFGPAGDTTGIWECPDLFEVPVEGETGKTKWVLMHSPAPYMQYFIGEFDGNSFRSEANAAKIYRPDDGPDYYAAIVFNNLPAGQQPVSIGWLNNWNYANDIPTTPWKSAMSLPRAMMARKINGDWCLLQAPVKNIEKLRGAGSSWKNLHVTGTSLLPVRSQCFELEITIKPSSQSVGGIRLAKGGDQYAEIGYDVTHEKLYLDRGKGGDTGFHKSFAKMNRFEKALKPRDGKISLRLFFDKSIIEVFANDGEVVMTAQVFPDEKNNGIELFSNGKDMHVATLQYWPMRSAW